MLKKLIGLLTILIVAVGLCGCMEHNTGEKQTPTTETSKTIKVVDLYGREVEVPKEVNRIVCCGPGCLRLIVYLNATDKVVGVEDAEKKWTPWGRPYRIAHPELANLPTIGQGGPCPKPNPEAIIQVKPDVIFVTYMPKDEVDALQQKTGIPVVVLSYGQLATFNNEDLFKSLELAGKILGKEDRAEEVIKFIKDCQRDLNNRTKDIPDDKKPTVYVGGIGFKGIHGIESTQCKYPPFMAVNAKNIADELGKVGYVQIDREKLLEWNPDVIFIDEFSLKLIKDDYSKNPNFYNSLKAFKTGNVYGLLPYNFYMTNVGTALADAV
ncbi:iron ABC transporter substrate-binding protein [Methanocaldococcus sp. FS406-22]|uniref:iron ABC transporter substrate-binding protein n=1 Tax=Methanocaldococcus sp. (strain FS406-22) TaxID=644281 RepID=UPI0001BF105C|nr:iron ABC transporter substrate-binding protein [Methanocaldococcus sp. FS406-22]